MRIIQISDTHFSSNHDFFKENTALITQAVANTPADLIIHTGDLAMDAASFSAHSHSDLALGAEWIAHEAREVLVVPGNHDVGDHPLINKAQEVNDARLSAWREEIGPDYWCHDLDGWRLIGLNAMLLGTGHSAEEQQFVWFEQQMQTDLPVAIFLHKPLFIDHKDEGLRGYWTVIPAPRARLFTAMNKANVKLVASGHLHIQHQIMADGVSYVWSPAASFVVGASQENLGGVRTLGFVVHEFGQDGQGEPCVTSQFIRPDGLTDLAIEPVQDILYPRAETLEAATS